MNLPKKFWWIAAGLLIVALAGAAVAFRPAYRKHKEQRFLGMAQDFYSRSDFSRAALSARQVLALNARNAAACQIMAEIAQRAGTTNELLWRQRVVEAEPSLEHRATLVAASLRLENPPFPTATNILGALTESEKSTIPHHAMAAQLALRLGRSAEAEEHIFALTRLEPTNELHRLNLATIGLASTNSAKSAEARAAIVKIAETGGLRIEALRSLSAYHANKREWPDAALFSTRLVSEPKAQFGDKLQHLTILHAGTNAALERELAALQNQSSTNAFQAVSVAQWMTAANLKDKASAWLQSLPSEVRATSLVRLKQAELLAGLQKWPELEALVQDQKWGAEETFRLAFLALALKSQNQSERADAAWQRAARAAAEAPEQLTALHNLARAWNWTERAQEILWSVVHRFPQERWAGELLAREYHQRGETLNFYRVLEARRHAAPSHLGLKNDFAIVCMLLQTNLPIAHSLAAEAYKSGETNHAFASTFAWSLHLQGKTAEALQVLERLPPADRERPDVAAYYGVLLKAAGQGERAHEFLVRAEKATLLPEERKLVADALANR